MADNVANPFALLMQPISDSSPQQPPGSDVIPEEHSTKVIPGDALSMPSIPTPEDTAVKDDSEGFEQRSEVKGDLSDNDDEVRKIDQMIQSVFLMTIDHGKKSLKSDENFLLQIDRMSRPTVCMLGDVKCKCITQSEKVTSTLHITLEVRVHSIYKRKISPDLNHCLQDCSY